MVKPINLRQLSYDVLVEVEQVRNKTSNKDLDGHNGWRISRNSEKATKLRESFGQRYRPALNHWHFNDGTMTLPDGLVVELKYSDHDRMVVSTGKGKVLSNLYYSSSRKIYVAAVKIIGVTAEYGAQLGMEVIDV